MLGQVKFAHSSKLIVEIIVVGFNLVAINCLLFPSPLNLHPINMGENKVSFLVKLFFYAFKYILVEN